MKLQSSQDPLNFPIKLNNKIAALQGVIERRRRAHRAGVYGLPDPVDTSRRAARQTRFNPQVAHAAGQSAAAAPEARADQGGAVESRDGSAAVRGGKAGRREGWKERLEG